MRRRGEIITEEEFLAQIDMELDEQLVVDNFENWIEGALLQDHHNMSIFLNYNFRKCHF